MASFVDDKDILSKFKESIDGLEKTIEDCKKKEAAEEKAKQDAAAALQAEKEAEEQKQKEEAERKRDKARQAKAELVLEERRKAAEEAAQKEKDDAAAAQKLKDEAAERKAKEEAAQKAAERLKKEQEDAVAATAEAERQRVLEAELLAKKKAKIISNLEKQIEKIKDKPEKKNQLIKVLKIVENTTDTLIINNFAKKDTYKSIINMINFNENQDIKELLDKIDNIDENVKSLLEGLSDSNNTEFMKELLKKDKEELQNLNFKMIELQNKLQEDADEKKQLLEQLLADRVTLSKLEESNNENIKRYKKSW